MKTTAIFAEILTVGVQALCWIVLGVYALDLIDLQKLDWNKLSNWSVLLTTVALALAYTAGVIIDRIADWCFHPKKRKANGVSFAEQRLLVYYKGEGMVDFLEYQRSRTRVARSTVINLVPFGIFGTISVQGSSLRIGVLMGSLLAILVTYWAWYRINATYEKRLLTAYRLILKDEDNSDASSEESSCA